MANIEALLSVKEVAAVLGLAEITVRKLCCAKKIPYIKLGGRVLFSPEQISTWIEAKTVAPIKFRGVR